MDHHSIIRQAIMDAANEPPTDDLPALAAEMVGAALAAAGLSIVPDRLDDAAAQRVSEALAGMTCSCPPCAAMLWPNLVVAARPGGSDG